MKRLFDRLRTGLWFVPSILLAVAAALAVILPAIDERIQVPSITGDPDTARALLGTQATATVTFAGLVFSITIVALQLTSSQFSPRALRQFLRDRMSQSALGAFVGGFLFDLMVLARIRSDPGVFVPGLAINASLIASVVTVFAFIGYVSHITQAIRVVHIIENITVEARITADEAQRAAASEPTIADVLAPLQRVAVIARPGPGAVLQDIDHAALVALARQHDVVMKLVPSIGDFVPRDASVVEVWSASAQPVAMTWSEVDRTIGFGHERTMTADFAFGLRQLVDIAEKALSPALNDPTTALQCIDRLHDLLRFEAVHPPFARVRCDDAGTVRMVSDAPTWDELVNLAFDEIRQYGCTALQITRRLRAALEDLQTVARADYQAVLREQVELLDRAVARSFVDAVDRARAGVADEQGLGDDDAVPRYP